MTETVKPKIIIVDENDKIIGYKDRGTLNKDFVPTIKKLGVMVKTGAFISTIPPE